MAIERGGVASFYVDGAYYSVKADIGIKLGGMTRKPVASSDGVAGFVTEWVAPEFTFTAFDGPAVSVSALKAINGPTVQVRMNNGKTYQIFGAFQVDDPDLKVDTGEVGGLKISGLRAQEILA